MNRARVMITFLLTSCVFSVLGYSQVMLQNNSAQPDTLERKFRVDFAIPDAPAFQLLDLDPSTILRPTTVREFTIAFSDFASSGSSITLPGAFAVEFSPGLIINGRTLSREAYEQHATWYRLRVSAATRRASGAAAPTEVAFGLRTSFVDDSDLRCNKDYVLKATSTTDKINEIYLQARLRAGPQGVISLNEDERQQVRELNEQLKATWADEKWNKTVFDVALGAKGEAKDSTGKGFEFISIAGWASYSLGVSDWGQCLLGCKLSGERDSMSNKFLFAGSIAGRVYLGSSTFKGFLEGQFSKVEKQNFTVLANSGAEANLWKGGWLTFSGGLEFVQGLGNPSIVTNMKINLGLADLIGL